jgi:hypothetical protein
MAEAAKVTTNGRAAPHIETDKDADSESSGSVCVRTVAGGSVNKGVAPGPLADCTISKEEVIKGQKFTTVGKGKGRTKRKYMEDKNKKLLSQTDSVSGLDEVDKGKDSNVKSTAKASWQSFVEDEAATLKAEANVSRGGKATEPGYAAAEAKDPFLFVFDTSGSFGFNLFWGDPSIAIDPDTGLPVSELSIFSDDPNGLAHLDFRAGLTGVTFNGKAPAGDLFVLSINARGIVDDPFDLDIEFLPWSGLGMTDSDIAAFVSYFRSRLSPLSDGSVGLPPGTRFALVGPGSPVPALAFVADAGLVTLSVGVVAEAQTAAVPPTWILLGIALGVVAVLGGMVGRARQRRVG